MTTPEPGGSSEAPPSTLGELLLTFSTITSVGLGFGTDHGIRTCYIGMSIGADLELPSDRTAALYYAALAKDGGCTCGASQMARFLGADEREALSDLAARNMSSELEMLRWMFRHAGRGSGPLTRARRTIDALVHGARFEREASLEECEVAQRVGERLGLGDEATNALGACTERWDGKGHPRGLAGEEIPLVARIINLGAAVEIAERFSGREAAIGLVDRDGGKAFDPEVAEVFLALAQREPFWLGLDAEDALRATVLDMEPVAGRRSGGLAAVDRLAEVVADLIDLKTPRLAGHARRVADRAQHVGERIGLDRPALDTLRRAALVHDIGLFAISAHELDRGSLSVHYRSHPVAAAELLGAISALRRAGDLAALHHERIDGSGWPIGAAGSRQPPAARVLAAACALDERAVEVGSEVDALASLAADHGFDRAVLDALREHLGAPALAHPEWPADLTDREAEVLRLAAVGLSVREIGERLVISRHTARHHLESAYAKIGCSTRAAAALFAAEHGLLD